MTPSTSCDNVPNTRTASCATSRSTSSPRPRLQRATEVADVAALRAARADLGVSVLQLWITYFSCGGNHDVAHLATYLAGDGHGADRIDHDHIIDALNDMYFDRDLDHRLGYGPT